MTSRNVGTITKANVRTVSDKLFDELSTKDEPLATVAMDGKPISIGRSIKSITKVDICQI